MILALILLCGAICLRVNSLIESRDLSLLIISILIGSFVIVFIEKITEVSVVGTTLKLERINEESEQLLEKLQIEQLKLRIELAFAPTNFFSGGDSVFTSREKLFEIAKEIKDTGLQGNPELKNKVLPLLINHAGFQLDHIQRYGAGMTPNPLMDIEDPLELL